MYYETVLPLALEELEDYASSLYTKHLIIIDFFIRPSRLSFISAAIVFTE